MGFHGGSDGKESVCNARDPGSIPGLGRSPGEGHGYPPTPVFLPGESHGQRSPMGYSSRGCKESDTTEWLTLSHFLPTKSLLITRYKVTFQWRKLAGTTLTNHQIPFPETELINCQGLWTLCTKTHHHSLAMTDGPKCTTRTWSRGVRQHTQSEGRVAQSVTCTLQKCQCYEKQTKPQALLQRMKD